MRCTWTLARSATCARCPHTKCPPKLLGSAGTATHAELAHPFPQYRKHMRRGSVASRNHRHLAMMSSARVASPASDRGVGKRPSSICHGRSSGGRRANFRSSFSSLRPAQVSPYHLDRSGMICCCHKATIVIVALAFRLLGSSQTQKLPKRIQLELEYWMRVARKVLATSSL